MPKFLISFFSVTALFINFAEARTITRGSAELLNPKAYSVGINVSQFSTTAIFDEDGVEKSMNEGDSFKMLNADFKLSYGLAKNLETSLLFRYRNITGVNQQFAVSASGPESAGVEAKYSFEPVGNTHYAFGVYYRQTLYNNTVYPSAATIPVDTIILGDDGTEYGAGLFLTHNFSPWKFDGQALYVSPPNDLSGEIQFRGQFEYLFTQLALIGGVEGIYSLSRNQLTQKPNLARGPSNMFNSLNRQVVAPFAGLNYAFDSFVLNLKGSTVVSGKSTDKGNTASIGVTFGTQGVTDETVKIESFKEYHIDGSVLKVSARGNFIKIDQGLSTDVEKGMKFDIYQTDYFGGNVLVASGVAYQIGADWTVIKLTKKYKEIEIKPGFAARGY
jgi:hypothetical protein